MPKITSNTPPKPTLCDNGKAHKPNLLAQIKKDADQNARTRLLLIQLQWLVILLMLALMLWQYRTVTKLSAQTAERLNEVQALSTRLNEMDDRLFALTPHIHPIYDEAGAQSDGALLAILLDIANQSYKQYNYNQAQEILKGLLYQLQTGQITLAAPIKAGLQKSLEQDLAVIKSAHNQTDEWQAVTVKIQRIRRFVQKQAAGDAKLWQEANLSLAFAGQSAMLYAYEPTLWRLNETKVHLNALLGTVSDTDKAALPAILPNQIENNQTKSDQTNASQSDSDALDGPPVPNNAEIQSIPQAMLLLDDIIQNLPKNNDLASIKVVLS